MIVRILIGIALSCSLLLWGGAEAAEAPIPAMSRTVVDTTGWLASQEALALEKRVTALRGSRGVQLAILIVGTTSPETIEAYSLRVAEKWKVGKKGEDSGLLLTIARSDRKFRLEVGYGLEGKLPDLLAKSILDDAMRPHLKREKPYDAILAGIDAIERELAKDATKPPESGTAKTEGDGDISIPFFEDLNGGGQAVAIVLGIVGGILLLVGFYGESGYALLAGLLIPSVGGALLGLLVNFAMFLLVALAAFLIALAIALGLTIGGAVVGGAFGGGGASADW